MGSRISYALSKPYYLLTTLITSLAYSIMLLHLDHFLFFAPYFVVFIPSNVEGMFLLDIFDPANHCHAFDAQQIRQNGVSGNCRWTACRSMPMQLSRTSSSVSERLGRCTRHVWCDTERIRTSYETRLARNSDGSSYQSRARLKRAVSDLTV
jgi:hypothetical protein